jgi:hypothetical protein
MVALVEKVRSVKEMIQQWFVQKGLVKWVHA